MAIVIHCTDSKWKLSTTVLECKRLLAHTGEAASTIFQKGNRNCEPEEKIFTTTKNNENDIMIGILVLTGSIQIVQRENQRQIHHVRCIAHVINLAMNTCLSLIQKEFFAIRSLITAIRGPVKRIELFEKFNKRAFCLRWSALQHYRWYSLIFYIQCAQGDVPWQGDAKCCGTLSSSAQNGSHEWWGAGKRFTQLFHFCSWHVVSSKIKSKWFSFVKKGFCFCAYCSHISWSENVIEEGELVLSLIHWKLIVSY